MGTRPNHCRMTAQQLRNFGLVLGPAGCAMMMWMYNSDYMANPDNRLAFKEIADRLASTPGKVCRRL
jgi:hypothetical protein